MGTAHGASATIPSFRPLHLGDGWSRLQSSPLARPPGLCLARWPEFSGARGLWLWLLIGRSPRLLQDVPCCVPSCPPYHSCRRPGQHSSCLSHGPRPPAAFPPAWPRDQPPSIPPCCLSLYLSRILQMYSYCLYGMAAISQRKSPTLKLALFPFCLFLRPIPSLLGPSPDHSVICIVVFNLGYLDCYITIWSKVYAFKFGWCTLSSPWWTSEFLRWEIPSRPSEYVYSVVSDSCDPMDCSPPGSSVHGIFLARILEWVVISYSRGSSWPRDQTRILLRLLLWQVDSLPLSHQGSPLTFSSLLIDVLSPWAPSTLLQQGTSIPHGSGWMNEKGTDTVLPDI